MPGRGRIARPIARGDIVLVAFPFTDLSATKRRPAVVLWADPARVDFLLAFISSQRFLPAVLRVLRALRGESLFWDPG